MAKKLIEADFKQGYVDECEFFKEDVAFLCYVDDGIQIPMRDSDFDTEMRLHYNKALGIDNQGHLNDKVGVYMAKTDNV